MHLCQNLIKVLKGELEEVKFQNELNKVTISYVLNFQKGVTNKCNNLTLSDYPDSTVFSWPFAAPSKRTKLSIAQVKKLLKPKKNNFSSSCEKLTTFCND